ncbi:unnamed protein product [Leptosia nina]|uniref:BRCT domain-containing protein n=1 Tax=Leptosia nina TaxID=320188 RepID=A0AAV1K2R9_9NEOP
MDLLNTGAKTNTKDHAGWTPLHEVVQSGRLDMVKLLLQHNTLINVPGPSNETPLHEAVRYKHKDIAAELVRNGANIDARNNKSETPLQLASEEMKIVLLEAMEGVQQTQGNNVTHIADMQAELDFEDIRLYSASNCQSIANKLKLLEKKHVNLHLEAKFTKKVNVLVVDTEENGTCVSSVDVLQGIVYEIWILSSQWVTKSTQERLEPLKDYEVKGIGHHNLNGPKNARYNKYKQLPGLFEGCHFYLHNFVTKYKISETLVLTKQILTKLITDADGVVLHRVPNPELIPDAEKVVPSHAKEGGKLETCSHYIIFKDMYKPMYNMSHFKALPLGWLIDCIEKYELCDP